MAGAHFATFPISIHTPARGVTARLLSPYPTREKQVISANLSFRLL